MKGELKRLKGKYESKKIESKEMIGFLKQKVEYLEDQLRGNEEGMMEVKRELEMEMEIIREQLMRKREAEITLEDYGELMGINNGLRGEVI